MLSTLRELCARFMMWFPPKRREWRAIFQHHAPILAPAFHNSHYGALLTLQILSDLQHGRLQKSRKRFQRLRVLCKGSECDADLALLGFVNALYYAQTGDMQRMSDNLRYANRHNHSYHLIHAMLGDHYLFNQCRFNDAFNEHDRAIDCIYKYLPLDERKRLVIATLQSHQAYALMMMHRMDEASALLGKSELAKENGCWQAAELLMLALQGRREDALAALNAQPKAGSQLLKACKPHIQPILDGTHPHFTVREVDPERLRAFWDWLLKEETHLAELWKTGGNDACFGHHERSFGSIFPSVIDHYGVDFDMNGAKPQLIFTALYSRTSEAMIDELLAVCPEEVASRWEIVRKP